MATFTDLGSLGKSEEVENVRLLIVLVLVRGGVCLLVVGVDVLLIVLPVLVVGVVLPVAVLHHLALRQVRRTLHKLREPAGTIEPRDRLPWTAFWAPTERFQFCQSFLSFFVCLCVIFLLGE